MIDYRIELRSEPSHHVPIDVRLRRALKVLKRSFGLTVVKIEDCRPKPVDQAKTPGESLKNKAA